jgi:hypothetical protein
MARRPSKSFRCPVISETVSITLRQRRSLSGEVSLFVQCSELDCQYVDANEPPCPLTPAAFAAEIEERAARPRD